MQQGDAIFSKATCETCGYNHATSNSAKDGSAKFFLCERCGYQHTMSNGEEMKMVGVGSFSFVDKNGIVAGGVFEKLETFLDKADELRNNVQGAKLFYTEKEKDGNKYFLVDYSTKKTYEFGVDDIICLDGLKKADPPSNLKVSFSK